VHLVAPEADHDLASGRVGDDDHIPRAPGLGDDYYDYYDHDHHHDDDHDEPHAQLLNAG
jgi:hypothetical protein